MESPQRTRAFSRRERERLRCREAILEAAAEVFGKQGYQRTSMKDIAERADISIGKLYIHFSGKEEIFRTLVENHIAEMHRRADEVCKGNDPPLSQLRCRVLASIEHFKKHIDFLMIYHNESPIAFEGFIRREIEHHRETAADLFEKAMKRGEMRKTNPDVLAAVFIGAVHELLYSLAVKDEFDRFDEVPDILENLILKPLLSVKGSRKGQVR